jgi:predicted ATP-dependent serine protease
VSHVNARGGAYGGATLSHAVDVVIRVENGVATPTKNRFGPMDPIRVWEEEAA